MFNIIITSTKSSDHITPVLVQLHCLTLLLTDNALHNAAPTYLPDLLQEDRPCCSLHHPQLVFTVLTSRLSTVGAEGARALSTVGAEGARAHGCQSTAVYYLVILACHFTLIHYHYYYH